MSAYNVLKKILPRLGRSQKPPPFPVPFPKQFEHHMFTNHTKYVLYFAVTIIGYKLYKDNKSRFAFIPAVNAASQLSGSLSGRRRQYNFIADVVEAVAPSVVYIEIKDSRRVDFFTGRPQTISNGSGFIIDADGLILTNAHVITSKPSTVVEVKLQNGKVYTGVVEDIDMHSDLATVRISAKDLPVIKLGRSIDAKPGEFVVAIGSPLSLSNTVTSGVLSSIERGSDELGLRGKDMVYLQTDAAITFGNSGGPLVNLEGEAIGVNSMKVTAGISFAIPIDYVKQFLKHTKSRSQSAQMTEVKRRYMGITMLTLTPQIIFQMHQRHQQIPPEVKNGVLVWKVIVGSPAHNGGIQPGDIVIGINDKQITSANDVYSVLGDTKSPVLRMTIIRERKMMQVAVEPEDLS